VVVVMDHVARTGDPKLLDACTLPLTGAGVVDLVITDLCVMVCDKPGLRLLELAPDVTLDEVRAKTAAAFEAGSIA
jgi:3-oxoacid CoA-transferase subunit B